MDYNICIKPAFDTCIYLLENYINVWDEYMQNAQDDYATDTYFYIHKIYALVVLIKYALEVEYKLNK